MPRRGAHKASGHKATIAISGRKERGAAEPIEARQRSKPAPEFTSHFDPGLYLVATPIGNLRDITLRALDLLGAADLVACEDTRVTAKLMARYGLASPRIAYHEHNAEQMRPQLIARLKAGAIMALVSDAGTPLISDPGYKLVRAALAEGISVTALPGPSSALAGLLLSALPCDRFLFVGFLPPKSAARQRVLGELATVPVTLIFFETAPRLAAALADMARALGERPAAVARELTKLFEEVRRGSLAELAAHYRDAGAPKGELVVIVGAPEPATTGPIAEDALDEALGAALATMSVKDASAAVAAKMGQPRRIVYQRALIVAGRST
jgi:16S rRNA (cytidine1402-2'-O)-methyltransferase